MPDGVLMSSLMNFLFPSRLGNPPSTGRLDLFAYYGPCDDHGDLLGGPGGNHIHTDLEIKHMIHKLNEEQLYTLIARPRATVETMVQELLPKAIGHCYDQHDIQRLFQGLSPDAGRYCFRDMQNIILKDQRRRLMTLIKGGEIQKTAREMIPFQTRPAKILQEITTRKKLRPNEEIIERSKRMTAFSGLVAPLEQQNMSNAIANNVKLVRGLGRVEDRWDRYCALRRVGKVSYVGARNMSRTALHGDDDLADKAARCSTLTASLSMNGPLGRRC